MSKVELINKIIELDSRWEEYKGKLFSKSKKELEKILRRKYEQETRKGSCDSAIKRYDITNKKKNTDSKELMTAVRMVSQLFIYGMLEEQGIDGTDKLKQMLCKYVDKIAEMIKNNEKK